MSSSTTAPEARSWMYQSGSAATAVEMIKLDDGVAVSGTAVVKLDDHSRSARLLLPDLGMADSTWLGVRTFCRQGAEL